jgi:hypothetical protein
LIPNIKAKIACFLTQRELFFDSISGWWRYGAMAKLAKITMELSRFSKVILLFWRHIPLKQTLHVKETVQYLNLFKATGPTK